MNIIRQGDVLLYPVNKLPEGVTLEKTDERNRIVLMHGEATGHAHAVHLSPEEVVNTAIAKARLYSLSDGQRYFEVASPVDLVHEEHTTHTIPPGIYELPAQVDMDTDKMPRRVLD